MVKPATHLHSSIAMVKDAWTSHVHPAFVGIQFSGNVKTTGWTYGREEEKIPEFCKTCLSPERVQYLIHPSVVKEV
jgi:hypothetical protein